MASLQSLTALLPLPITLLSLYTGYTSYLSIAHVLTYKSTAEHAAEYSNTAERELHLTQTTEGAGAIATLLSLLSSLYLAAPLLPGVADVVLHSQTIVMGLAAVNAAVAFGAKAHVRGYWKNKAKVPFVKRYSEAIDTTNTVGRLLGYAGWAWVGLGIVGGVGVVMGA